MDKNTKQQTEAEFLLNPVNWSEAFLRNKGGTNRTLWPHQKEDMLCTSTNIGFCCKDWAHFQK